ncbi:site-2 protease family protein [Erysipelotrichaceae bacterium HCN-30851]
MRFRKIHVSWLWIPYLILLPYLGVGKIIGWIFFILSIHEMAHIICAIMFHYEIERVIIYPFGLSAQIAHMGHGSVFHEIMIISAGPLMHVSFPFIFMIAFHFGLISNVFMEYLNHMNASILLFNLLPIYPLDGGRLLQTFFHCFLRFKQAEKMTYLFSFVNMIFIIYFQLLQGASAIVVLCFLGVQLLYSWRMLVTLQRHFFHYRLQHPAAFPYILNTKDDLYRARKNIMKDHNGFMEEETWLRKRLYFYHAEKKNSRL